MVGKDMMSMTEKHLRIYKEEVARRMREAQEFARRMSNMFTFFRCTVLGSWAMGMYD